jgi:hypothetical protein
MACRESCTFTFCKIECFSVPLAVPLFGIVCKRWTVTSTLSEHPLGFYLQQATFCVCSPGTCLYTELKLYLTTDRILKSTVVPLCVVGSVIRQCNTLRASKQTGVLCSFVQGWPLVGQSLCKARYFLTFTKPEGLFFWWQQHTIGPCI